jgi:hypothetical protein
MKPDNSFPPFYPDAIPLYIEPDLWDETKPLRFRSLKFVVLYTLSTVINFLMVFVPVAFVSASRNSSAVDGILGTAIWWLLLSTPIGIWIGLGAWGDFARTCQKLADQAELKMQEQSTTDPD